MQVFDYLQKQLNMNTDEDKEEPVMKKIALMMFAAGLLAGCTSAEKIPAVKNFDTARYMGKWYEYRRLPNYFERGMTDVSAEYTLQKDGTVKVVNRGIYKNKEKSITGTLRSAGSPGTGELEVSFFKPFYGSYRIIKLAPDYRYSVVTGRNKSLLWILSRTRELPAEDVEEIMTFLKQHGFPVEKLTATQ